MRTTNRLLWSAVLFVLAICMFQSSALAGTCDRAVPDLESAIRLYALPRGSVFQGVCAAVPSSATAGLCYEATMRADGDAGLAEAFSISAWMMMYAAALLAAGFWKRKSFVRWQGLILMVFTIGKVFLYDMHSLSSGYRILSFFALGIVLMVVSFAYQKDWLNLRDADDEVAR